MHAIALAPLSLRASTLFSMSQFRWRRLCLRCESIAVSLSPNMRLLRMAEQDPASTPIPKLRRACESYRRESHSAQKAWASVCCWARSFVDDPEKGFMEKRERGSGEDREIWHH
ncbi:hypothetical protein MRX96_029458 [Rhipicephalus microplus]